MANSLMCLGLVLFMAIGSNAFWFSQRTTASATGDVDPSCIALARQGNCDFYECFERRLPCGRDWYILKYGQYYCNKIQRLRETFTPAGQSFLNDSQRCLMTELIPAYQQDMVDCHELKHTAMQSIASCYENNAFCTVLGDNTEQFTSIYEASDLFTRGAGSLWRLMATLGAQCGSDAITGIAQNAWNSIRGIFNSD